MAEVSEPIRDGRFVREGLLASGARRSGAVRPVVEERERVAVLVVGAWEVECGDDPGSDVGSP